LNKYTFGFTTIHIDHGWHLWFLWQRCWCWSSVNGVGDWLTLALRPCGPLGYNALWSHRWIEFWRSILPLCDITAQRPTLTWSVLPTPTDQYETHLVINARVILKSSYVKQQLFLNLVCVLIYPPHLRHSLKYHISTCKLCFVHLFALSELTPLIFGIWRNL
jgi:hypothetical protein